jgi:glycine oxidase
LKRTHFITTHVVRGPRAYLLPKDDGTAVVGAQEEADSTRQRPRAASRRFSRTRGEGAADHDLPVERIEVGCPGTRDHLPLIGPTRTRAHHGDGSLRHGICLLPTADASARASRQAISEPVAVFAPDRS